MKINNYTLIRIILAVVLYMFNPVFLGVLFFMPHIHYDQKGTDNVGTVAGTAEKIATLRTSSIATDLLGFILNSAGSGTVTAAEARAGTYQIDTKSLAPQKLICQDQNMRGGGPATNIGGFIAPTKFVPFRAIIPNVANKNIDFFYNAEQNDGSDVTEDTLAMGGLVYAEGSFPLDVMKNLNRLESRVNWMDSANHDDAFNTSGEDFDDEITIPNWLKEIVAFGVGTTLDTAESTAEPVMPSIEIQGTIPSLSPMKVPAPAIHAGLGTAVGAGLIGFEQILPAYINNINMVDSTLNFVSNLLPAANVASATGLQTITLYGRN